MPAFAAPIEVVQAALHRVGEETIASLEDGSPPALIAATNYEHLVRAYLTNHAWSFACDDYPLTLQGPTEAGAFAYRYIRPPELLNVSTVSLARGRRLSEGEFKIVGERIYANTNSPLEAFGQFRADESTWPADFTEAVIVRLEALFLEGLLDKWQDARLKERDAGDKLLKAMTRDKRQNPGIRAETDTLPRTWRGGRGRFRGAC